MEEPLLFSIKEIFLRVLEGTTCYTKQEEKKLLQQCKQLEQHYRLALCQPQTQAAMESLVHTSQNMVTCLLNYLHEEKRIEANSFFTTVIQQLISFLRFIETKSSSYFNRDAILPVIIWQPISEAIEAQLIEVEKSLLDRIDPQLIALLQQVFQEKRTTISYRTANYWQELMNCFVQDAQSPLFNTQTCIELLLLFNFNHPLFIGYIHNEFLYAYTNTENVQKHWQESLRFINRIIPLHDRALLPQEASCYSVLIQRVQTELSVVSLVIEQNPSLQKLVPYKFSLSVPQMAVFFRAQVEAGMIMQENTTEMIRHLSESLPTTRNTTIGFKSFYNKYHDPDRAAIQIMLEYNTRMQQFLKSQLI